MTPTASADPTYDEVAGFLATLVAGGMRHIVLSPGSRSTPLSVCAAANPHLNHWMQINERTAAFFALGIAKATRTPVALVCTSGTAAANYFPAVIEASRTGVPLLVISADRPPELQGGWGTNQTIDQADLFGRYPRWFHAMPVGGTSTPMAASAVAREALMEMWPPSTGPVHINWPFRKPLEPIGAVPVSVHEPLDQTERPASADDPSTRERLVELAHKVGVIVAGPQDDPRWSASLSSLAAAANWPILAESTSQLRLSTPSSNTVSTCERALLVEDITDALVPEVVIFAGATPTGTSALAWAEAHGAITALLIDPGAPWSDAGAVDAEALILTPETLEALAATIVSGDRVAGWLDRWLGVDRQALDHISQVVDNTLTGPATVRAVTSAMPANSQLMVANSMAVRDLDRYVGPRSAVRVHVSRGASGIDGQIATAAGIAASTNEPVTLLVGDIAFLHDVGSVLAAARLELDLNIVVINDDGGGIFSMLPIADFGDTVPFDELFHTPHGSRLEALDGLVGVTYETVTSAEGLASLNLGADEGRGVRIIDVSIDHETNMAVRAMVDKQLTIITP